MVPRPNRTKRWTPTTIITIVILLGAVVGVSSMVAQKPAEPPKPPAPPPVTVKKQEMKVKLETEERRMHAELEQHASTVKPVESPTAISIDNTYFLHHKPGEQGLKQAETDLQRQQAEYDAYQRKMAALKKPDSASPPSSSSPGSTSK